MQKTLWAPHGWIMELPLTLRDALEIFAELTFSEALGGLKSGNWSLAGQLGGKGGRNLPPAGDAALRQWPWSSPRSAQGIRLGSCV